ncbi:MULTISPECIES: hypothetical protein [unclassified Crossiella]|uniref:hypothetical protein n=1 Tax=unclassified Crossiella TaxID=2620835 RepID=UPI002000137D|nr:MULTISPECIES: hypothetical protein [unclassified Crossiella]MCK2237162.1 hypothetical protein [Crossiella sp. S99.2]MCK2252527.1 hypothetical protein [Crossiella sp. S99.1]
MIHVGLVITAEPPVGIPIIHISAVPKHVYVKEQKGCLPERVKLYCGRSLGAVNVELAAIGPASVICHQCALFLPEKHWAILPFSYRDPAFRRTISRMVIEAPGGDHRRSVAVYRSSRHHAAHQGEAGGRK